MAKRRNQKLANECFERDAHRCQKCGRKDALHAHHMWALVDGGADVLENLITLCSLCHAEWHCLDELDTLPISFSRWMQLPPWRLIVYLIGRVPDDMTLKAVVDLAKESLSKIHSGSK